MNRRDFFKALAAAGIGGAAIYEGVNNLDVQAAVKKNTGQVGKNSNWGMVIDVSKFQGDDDFRRVADACHQYHNVPNIKDQAHEVKWIWKEDFEHTFAELESEYLGEKIKKLNFPVLCNHCQSPACVRVCPTKATFKRDDGIVAMDYHRCVGCRFCMAACPYGSRSFNFIDPQPYIKNGNPAMPARTQGVVEKCTFCVERLDKGMTPVCVEASRGGILFGDLEDPKSEVRKVLNENFAIRRKVELGTGPNVYYVIRGGNAGA